jgi:hypothetical protein
MIFGGQKGGKQGKKQGISKGKMNNYYMNFKYICGCGCCKKDTTWLQTEVLLWKN